jgi:hypothetical protein
MKAFIILFSLIVVSAECLAQHPLDDRTLPSAKWYGDMLERFHEPSGLGDPPDSEVYRVRISPTFNNPVLFRIVKNSSGIILISKRLGGQGGYDQGQLKQEKKRTVSEQEWNHFINLLDAASFWELPTDLVNLQNEKGQVEMEICLDGADWLIEGIRNAKYHGVVRYCPGSKEFMDIGRYLLGLSNLKLKRKTSY